MSLATPELLLEYFSYLTGKELVVAASVCKTWSAVALDSLWRSKAVPLSALLEKLPWMTRCSLDGDEWVDAKPRATWCQLKCILAGMSAL